MKTSAKFLSMLLCLVLLCTSVLWVSAEEATMPFTDIAPTSWYTGAVQYVYDHSLMTGTTTTQFSPKSNLTRAMFVTILGRMEGIDQSEYTGVSFSDVKGGKWYSAYVEWASEKGIVNGYGNGLFGTNDPVTREQMATMIARYLEAKGIVLVDSPNMVSGFHDQDSVSKWARAGLEIMRTTGIIAGDTSGYFRPASTATRAEAATIFMRLHKAILMNDHYIAMLDKLVGTFHGAYMANQGETALTLTVYKENGKYRALFDFYNLPNQTNAQEGSYYMNVFVDETGYILKGTEWIEKPETYEILHLSGNLEGDVFTGKSPTEFAVVREGGHHPLEDLAGTHYGFYYARQGQTGLTLTVYEEDDCYKALFDFYNLPGHNNAEPGSYYMNVRFNYEALFVLEATEWIEKPTTYDFVNLKGDLTSGVFSGADPTQFWLLREGAEDPREALIGTYEGSYFAGQGETGLTLEIYKEDDLYKAIFKFYNLPGQSNSAEGSYYMVVNNSYEGFTFQATEWIERPGTYSMLDLAGQLDGDVLSGTAPWRFSVTRVSE